MKTPVRIVLILSFCCSAFYVGSQLHSSPWMPHSEEILKSNFRSFRFFVHFNPSLHFTDNPFNHQHLQSPFLERHSQLEGTFVRDSVSKWKIIHCVLPKEQSPSQIGFTIPETKITRVVLDDLRTQNGFPYFLVREFYTSVRTFSSLSACYQYKPYHLFRFRTTKVVTPR